MPFPLRFPLPPLLGNPEKRKAASVTAAPGDEEWVRAGPCMASDR